jgi:hypothetical protein
VYALALFAKAALAVTLVIAGGAKLTDLPAFAGALRLFVPLRSWLPALPWLATAIAAGELALGAASIAFPGIWWPNLAVLLLTCGFAAVSAVGYVLFRGRSCHCFGSLFQRKFDLATLLRAAIFVAAAAFAMARAGRQAPIGGWASFGLLCAAALVALAAFAAARALAVGSPNLGGG